MAFPRFGLAGGRIFTTREALIVTACSAVVPGFAHLRSGRRRTGLSLFAGYAALAASWALLAPDGRLVPAAAAVAWVVLVLVSYRAVRPWRPAPPVRAASGAAVAALCVLVALVPPALARRASHGVSAVSGAVSGRAVPARPRRAVGGPSRVNLVLAGRGPRARSMVLASVDTRTGDTVLLILPGDLRRVPVPGLPGDVPLASVSGYGSAHPGATGSMGGELLERAVGAMTGVPVGHHRTVRSRDLRGIVAAGRRTGGCAVGGGPLAAGMARGHARPVFAAMAAKVRRARVSGVRLVPPGSDHGRPDYRRLRAAAARALTVQAAAPAPHHDSRIPGDLCR